MKFKFRHTLYPSPRVMTNHGEVATFSSYEFETDDKKVAAELGRNPDIEQLKPSRTEAAARKAQGLELDKALATEPEEG